MSTKNLSGVATAVIESYGNTALNVISAYRSGSERVIGFVDQRFEAVVSAGAVRLSDELRTNLIEAEKRLSGYYVKGIEYGTERAERTVSTAVDFASKGVERMAANAERFDQATKLGALEALNRMALPAARAVNDVVVRIEERSGLLAKRVAGKPAVVKAVTKKAKAVAKTASSATTKATKKAATVKKTVVRKANTVARKTRAAASKAAAA